MSAPLIALDAVTAFLDRHGLGAGAVTATRIGEGHSNITYRLDRGDVSVVLRRPPRPPLPPSAHDVIREARIHFSSLRQRVRARDVPEVEETARWLADHVPTRSATSLVHGDDRLGNLMVHRERPEVLAILD